MKTRSLYPALLVRCIKIASEHFGKTVNLNSGAYLIIEHTEALHVIDVNSGYKSVGNNQEQNALETNLEAAEEIARQLIDLGGELVDYAEGSKHPPEVRFWLRTQHGIDLYHKALAAAAAVETPVPAS